MKLAAERWGLEVTTKPLPAVKARLRCPLVGAFSARNGGERASRAEQGSQAFCRGSCLRFAVCSSRCRPCVPHRWETGESGMAPVRGGENKRSD